METLLSPEGGLAGVLIASFLAATVIPFSSEAVLYGYLQLHPEFSMVAVAFATIGNTAGGMTTYLLGRLIPKKPEVPSALDWLQRYGAPATFFAWLPIVGDGLCIAAGWLRVNWPAALAWMAAGRLFRYLLVLALTNQ